MEMNLPTLKASQDLTSPRIYNTPNRIKTNSGKAIVDPHFNSNCKSGIMHSGDKKSVLKFATDAAVNEVSAIAGHFTSGNLENMLITCHNPNAILNDEI